MNISLHLLPSTKLLKLRVELRCPQLEFPSRSGFPFSHRSASVYIHTFPPLPPPPCLFHYPPVLQCHILRLAPASPSTVCSGYATSPISGLGAPDGNSTQPSTQKTFTDEEIKDESLLKNSGSYSECYVLEEFNLAYLKLTCCKAQHTQTGTDVTSRTVRRFKEYIYKRNLIPREEQVSAEDGSSMKELTWGDDGYWWWRGCYRSGKVERTRVERGHEVSPQNLANVEVFHHFHHLPLFLVFQSSQGVDDWSAVKRLTEKISCVITVITNDHSLT